MNMEIELFTKRSNEVDMISDIENLVNFVPEHELVEGD